MCNVCWGINLPRPWLVPQQDLASGTRATLGATAVAHAD
jgi:hypothetical protein